MRTSRLALPTLVVPALKVVRAEEAIQLVDYKKRTVRSVDAAMPELGEITAAALRSLIQSRSEYCDSSVRIESRPPITQTHAYRESGAQDERVGDHFWTSARRIFARSSATSRASRSEPVGFT